jgi:hypothetical protein
MSNPKLNKLDQYIWNIFEILYIKDVVHVHHMNTQNWFSILW